MNNCIKIRLVNVNSIHDKWKSDDGYVYLDLEDEFKYRETKQATELTDANKLKFNYSLDFSLDATDKNTALLNQYRLSSIIDNEYDRIEVQIVIGSKIVEDSDMYVKLFKTKFECQIRLKLLHWASSAQNLNVCDINLGSINITRNRINNIIENEYLYDSANSGVWFPFCNYGFLITDTNRNNFINPIGYWRPWHYVTGLLEKGFCAVGYSFESALFNSTFGKSLICYLIDPNYGTGVDVPLLNASGQVDNDYLLHSHPGTTYGGSLFKVHFKDNVVDGSNVIDDECSVYNGNGEVNIKGAIKFTASIDCDKVIVYLSDLRSASQSGHKMRVLDTIDFDEVKEDSEYEWEFDVENISITDISNVGIFLKVFSGANNIFPDIIIKEESIIEYTGVRKYWDEGTNIDIGKIIDPEIKFIDLIKGISQALNLKWYTNEALNSVLALQPYQVELHSEVIEGFYVETDINDITSIQDTTSIKTVSPELTNPKTILIKYKDSTDKGISEKEYKEQLWSKRVELNDKYANEEETKIENALFEPTRNTIDRLSIPTIKGDTEHTWDIKPRIAIARGNVIQDYPALTLKYTVWDYAQTKLIPTASQFTPTKIGVTHNSEVSVLEYSEAALVFDVNEEEKGVFGDVEFDYLADVKTLYNLVYYRWIKEQYLNLTLQYLIEYKHKSYDEIDFRKYYMIQHLGRTLKCRIGKVSDFHYCSELLTPVDFVPEIQATDLCGLVSEPYVSDSMCKNSPTIAILSYLNDCWTFILTGVSNNVITNVLFEYREIGDTIWITSPNITSITTEICSITDPFEVRATVDYEDDCPTLTTPSYLVNPCPDREFEIRCYPSINTHGQPETFANIVSLDSSITVWTTISFEYSDSAGPIFNWVPYVEGTLITGYGERVFRATIQIENCPTIDIVPTGCTIEPGLRYEEGDCSDIDLELVCTPSTINAECVTFELVGTVPINLSQYDYTIKYSTSEDNVVWTPWAIYDEEDEVCGQYIKGKVTIIFCDSVCPPMCLESFCGCSAFSIGGPSDIAFCNDGNI